MNRLFFLTVFLFPLFASATETRCGWLDNPAPSNIWLIDKGGSWTISTMAGYSVDDDSLDNIPWDKVNYDEYVATNVHYGFFCACLAVETNSEQMQIIKIAGGKQLLLKHCLEDREVFRQMPGL